MINDKHVHEIKNIHPTSANDDCGTGVPCRISKRVKNRTNWRWICCNGIYIEILKIIVSTLKAEFELYIVEDNQFGKYKDGKWDGMISAVHSKNADIALHQLNVIRKRFTAVDFTFPLTTSPTTLGIVRHKFAPKYDAVNWSFISYLERDFVGAIIATTLLLIVFLVVAESALKKPFFNLRYPSRESMSYVTGVLLQKEVGAKLAETWPSQVAALVFACGTTVLIGTYTAKLTASNIDKDVETFKGFNDYRVGLFSFTQYKAGEADRSFP